MNAALTPLPSDAYAVAGALRANRTENVGQRSYLTVFVQLAGQVVIVVMTLRRGDKRQRR